MNKISLKSEWFSLALIAATIILGIIWYPHLPAQVPAHWNIAGQVDNYMTPLGHVLTFTGLMIGMYLLFLLIPFIEPRKENLAKSGPFLQFIKSFLLFFFFVLFVAISWTSIHSGALAIDKIVSAMMGFLFIGIGNYLGQVKSNFFMGIRTPWTLSSDDIWQKTHRLGSYTFVIGGLLFLLGLFMPTPWNFTIPFVGILLASLIPVVYSYILFVNKK